MKKRVSTKTITTGIVATVAVAAMLSGFFYWQNNSIMITHVEHNSPKVPEAFHGYTILQVSDLHNKVFGKNNSVLLKKMESASPDIIVITGDIIDRRRYDLEAARVFVKEAVKLAPVYYVSGNHEAWSGMYEEIKKVLLEEGVEVLDNAAVLLEKEEAVIHLLGLGDPAFLVSGYREKWDVSHIKAQLEAWDELEGFRILLSHRPDLFPVYGESQVDLVFSGHAHGGQIRLPIVGSLFAPDQGFFPAYTSGAYTFDKTTMYVSRGLGNSVFPLRVFNRPELIVVQLKNC